MTARLVLGTAQFGLDYGIVNRTGKLSSGDVAAVLALARDAGVDSLDTAAAYGDAEEVLGQSGVDGFRIVTKTPPLREPSRSTVVEHCRRSLERLRQSSVHAILVHNSSDLMGPDAAEAYAGLAAVKEAGLAEHIGVSVYEAEEAVALTARFDLDVVQCPFSVLDTRMADAMEVLSARGVALHVRSVFLQGVALQPPDRIPDRLAGLRPGVASFQARAAEQGASPLEAALVFARDWPGVDGVVVGAASVEEFKDIVAAFKRNAHFSFDADAKPDSNLVDPRRWA